MKIQKGRYGYIRSQKLIRFLRTLVIFVLDFVIFFVGLSLNGGDRRNIYTVIAAVGVIPAAMSLVGMIMMWLRPPMDAALYESCSAKDVEKIILYELFLTTREHNLYLDATIVRGDQVLSYTHEMVGADKIRIMEEHITRTLRAEHAQRKVKITQDLDLFLSRVESMEKRPAGDKDHFVRDVLCSIAL